MNFWIFAVALLAIPAAVISWPFFAGSKRERLIGLMLLVLMPLAGLVLYGQIGNPVAINPPPVTVTKQASMDVLLADLQQRMAENPDDPDGWMILGRSLKSMRRYAEAVDALTNARRLRPDNALIMVELAEASLYASGKPEISEDIRQLLETALEIDPFQQKGLWLLGMAASNEGDYEHATALWQKLLNQVEPGSGIAQTVNQQIEQAQIRMGEPLASAGLNIPVNISMADEHTGPLPAQAVLFVFAHPDTRGGMPLAVKRINTPSFPLTLNLTDQDLLRPGTSLQSFEQLTISARISMSGVASSASGDLQANVITFSTRDIPEIALHIDQRIP